jgi:hypothetical protein
MLCYREVNILVWLEVFVEVWSCVLCRLSNLSAVNGVRFWQPWTLLVKLSDFTVWRHIWRKNWANCAVFTGNSAGIKVSFPVVFHTENCAFHSENLTVSSVYLPTPRWHPTELTKKLTNLMGNLCCFRKHSVQFFVQFSFTQLKCTV